MKLNKLLDNISIYEAGKPIELVVREYGIDPKNIIKLASNENPNGVSVKVQEGIKEIVSKMALYPDDSFFELKDGLAREYGVASSNIVIGAGSDQVIEFAIRAKCDSESKILIAGVTFAMYEIYAKQIGATVIKTASPTHNLEQFLELYNQHKPDMVFLCLPNNPLGEAVSKDDVYTFMKKLDKDTLVVVDGAYQEYAKFKDSAKEIVPSDLIATFPNSLYLGTFSKAYGLGGMRVGYGVGNDEIIKALHKIRPPFNITTLSLKAAILALEDKEFVNKSVALNFSEMERYVKFFEKLGLETIESYTNFITVNMGEKYNSTKVSQNLLQNGVIIRNLASYGLNSIRITIGLASQNDRFFEIFESIGLNG